MAIKIKKQYKQPDGTLIEVEGTESEVEAFEKKQRKQKQQIEDTERKRTILYGKDLELIRKIIQEELAKVPPRVTQEYRYIYQQQPNYTSVPSITWTAGNTYGTANVTGTLTTTNSADAYDSKTTIASSFISAGSVTANNWGSTKTTNFLMSPSNS